MSELGKFAAAFCSVSIIMGFIYMLCPKGNIERAVRYILSLITVVVIAAALPIIGNIAADIEIKSNFSLTAEELEIEALRLVFERALKNNGIEFSEIELYTDNSENGGIRINRVVVFSSGDSEEIRRILEDEKGEYTVEVYP